MRAAIESTDAYWAYADPVKELQRVHRKPGAVERYDYKIMKRSRPIADAKKFASAGG